LQRLHPENVNQYEEELKDDTKKRKVDSKQSDLSRFVSVDPTKTTTRIDKLIVDFVVKGMHSLAVVEEEHFIRLIKGNFNFSKNPILSLYEKQLNC